MSEAGEGGGLFGGLFARGPVAGQVDDRAMLQAMLDAEAALARASAAAGVIPAAAAEAIAAGCDAGRFDVAALGRASAAAGNPVVPLVQALAGQLPEEAAGHLHQGATSQDVLDTAAMLVAHRALGPLLEDLAAAAGACARLAEAHRGSVLAGRTLLQQAVPVTFGLKAAGWLVGLDETRLRLAEVRRRTLAVQLGGAAGTLAGFGDRGLDVLAGFAADLGLAEPTVPWHAVRARPAALAGALGACAGVLGKVARDVALLAQNEVAEVREGGDAGRGGSSAMPHKRNPVAAVAVAACAARVPGLVATMLAAMPQEHERAVGGWHAEWEPQRELLRLVGSAASWCRELLEHLEVDAGRMRANLDAAGGLPLAEAAVAALAGPLGRRQAREAVELASRRAAQEGRALRDVLLESPAVAGRLGVADLDRALDPAAQLGAAQVLVDRALAAHRTTEEQA
ncbi:MAG TPA: 3-carboxy-cis,cis-muconate cycloisomerase [Actinomycetota bacterium]|nr:3-carboxy-cis,cis-muconate cycloisomerase [Actinomycetota bacterium]